MDAEVRSGTINNQIKQPRDSENLAAVRILNARELVNANFVKSGHQLEYLCGIVSAAGLTENFKCCFLECVSAISESNVVGINIVVLGEGLQLDFTKRLVAVAHLVHQICSMRNNSRACNIRIGVVRTGTVLFPSAIVCLIRSARRSGVLCVFRICEVAIRIISA